jgi:D-hydroxyproline dehydrogenase subunit gamma
MSTAQTRRDIVTIYVNGSGLQCAANCTVATALLNAGFAWFRTSVRGSPRAPLCGMGSCHECGATVDGHAYTRTCIITVREGMRITTAEGERQPAAPRDPDTG